MRKLIYLFICMLTYVAHAQVTYPANRTQEKMYNKVVYTNATIWKSPTEVITNGSIYVVDGKIQSINENVQPAQGVMVIDLKGAVVYPAFIDLYSEYGIQKEPKEKDGRAPQFVSDKDGPFNWNEAVEPEYNASAHFKTDSKEAEKYRKMGFGLVLSHSGDGIFRGTAAFVNTAEANEVFALEKAYASTCYSFYKGNSSQDYPRSQMGAIALMRQSFYDADWYSRQTEEHNLSLEAINRHKQSYL